MTPHYVAHGDAVLKFNSKREALKYAAKVNGESLVEPRRKLFMQTRAALHPEEQRRRREEVS